jgi:N-acetylneuraminic acid mutarotase
MIVWGGGTGSTFFDTGGRYNPSTDSWTATSIVGAPSARYVHTAVWTGSEMIVWGGYPNTNTGGRYNPGMDSWIATSTTGAPSARYVHTAVETGSEMIVWGGTDDISRWNTGGRYCAQFRCAKSDSNADTHANCNTNSYSDSNCNCDGIWNTNG